MNRVGAYELLTAEFAPYREMQYEELTNCVGQSSSRLVNAKDAAVYVIDVAVRWQDRDRGKIVVEGMAAVADCGPLHRIDESFVVSPPADTALCPR